MVSSTCPPSRIEVCLVRNKSRLTLCESVSPTKIPHPFLSDEAVCVMLSSFGGGMVQGDQVAIDLHCQAGARLLLRTQANSRVFKNTRGQATTFHIHGRVEDQATVIFLPDPLVMHAGSEFSQTQTWQLADQGHLLLGDWLQSGRSDSGEAFAFRHYANHCEIRQGNQLLLLDPFEIRPDAQDVRGAGSFGEANLLLTLYAVGKTRELLETTLGSLPGERTSLTQVHPLLEKTAASPPSFLCSLVHMEDRPVSIFRALGKTRADFDAVFARLQNELVKAEWLNGGDTLLPAGVGAA